MIELIGVEGTSEHFAAQAIKEALIKTWPGIDVSPKKSDHVIIASGVKLSGYRVSDIDVVVAGVLYKPRRFMPKKILHDHNGKRVVKRPVILKNFVVAVEVKSHDSDSVKINGDHIIVQYTRNGQKKWKSATEQNINQVHSLRPYFEDEGLDLFVHRCVVMQGISRIKAGGVVPAIFDGRDFLSAIASVSRVSKSIDGYTISSDSNDVVEAALRTPIFTEIKPSALDRQRMERIAADATENYDLANLLGRKMLRLRGYGGSGKTVMLIQAAWKAFEQRGTRSIILTYNHALAADIRRLLALLRIPSSSEEGGIAVFTVMSFMYSWLKRLGIITDDSEFDFDQYEKNCTNALAMFHQGALTAHDVDTVRQEDPDRFDFDCILVDEAQDWPQEEADMLKALYGANKISLADGVDQLIRGRATRWEAGVNQSECKLVTLSSCLRMKKNLSIFANQVASEGGVKWEVGPNRDAPGGKVYLLVGGYQTHPNLHKKLVEESKEKGNAEVDFLFCVPPTDVSQSGMRKRSGLANHLIAAGYDVWDGVDDRVRKDFPRSLTQFRVVQYASCRGLEGWVVVLQAADEFWRLAREERYSEGISGESDFKSLDDIADRDAWLKLLIALTRPIDTLVIDLKNPKSHFSQKLIHIAMEFPDIVQLID